MRYIMLIYSQSPERELSERNYNAHWALMEEAGAKGAFVAAEPLPPRSITRTVRPGPGSAIITDGPFAETKEQLAGFYIFDCQSENEALEWGQKIMGACTTAAAIEVRPLPGVPAPLPAVRQVRDGPSRAGASRAPTEWTGLRASAVPVRYRTPLRSRRRCLVPARVRM